MGRRGPAPEPTETLKLRGSRRATTARFEDEPQPEPGCLDCPDELTGRARVEWERIAPKLSSMGVLTDWERGVLTGYCQSWGLFIEAHLLVEKSGLLVPRTGGGMMKNPAIAILNDAKMAMLRFAQDLGLSPASRTRLNVKPAEKAESGAAAYFKKSG